MIDEKLLLPDPNQLEIVPLPLQLFNLRRRISNKARVAKEPVLEKAVGPRWIELDIAGIKEPVSNHDFSFTTVTAFVMPQVFREVFVRIRNDLWDRKTLNLRFSSLQDLLDTV